MRINYLKLNNFGVYSGEQTITFFSDGSHKSHNNITLIGGMNGRGKTSILEAVLLVLYGSRSPRIQIGQQSYSSYLKDAIHGRGHLGSESWIEMGIDFPFEERVMPIVIRRSWRIKNVRVTDKLEISHDGIIDSYFAENWDSFIEGIIPAAISELFFFDGERIIALAESDETIDSLQRAMRSLLGIETVDLLIKDLKLVIRKNQQKSINSIENNRLEKLQKQGDLLQKKEARLLQEKAHFQSLINRLESKNKLLDSTYLQIGGSLIEGRKKNESRRNELINSLTEQKIAFNLVAASSLPFELVREKIVGINKTLQKDRSIEDARAALPIINDMVEDIKMKLRNSAENLSVVDLIDTILLNKKREIEYNAKQKPVFPLIKPEFMSELLELQLPSDIMNAKNSIAKYEELEYELEQLERTTIQDIDKDELDKITKERATNISELRILYQKLHASEHELTSIIAKQKKIESEILKIGIGMADEEEAGRIIKYASQLQESMKLFRERITAQKISKLSKHIFESFQLLSNKNELIKKIVVDVNTLKISLYGNDDLELPKSKLSSGERQMLALAILWGLGKASGKTLPIIIDTPMGRLDSAHRLHFVEKYLPNASHQVIVLSTDTEIEGQYYEILKENIEVEYHLIYDEEKQATTINPGYFPNLITFMEINP